MWELEMYSVSEEVGVQGVTVCAIAIGSAEIYPQVQFMTTTLSNDTGETKLVNVRLVL